MNLTSVFRFILILTLSLPLIAFQACKKEDITDPEEEEEVTNPFGIDVEVIPAFEVGETVTRTGNVSAGKEIDLDFADLSNVACFPATRFIEFEGNQVFYSVTIPQGAELIATVTPTGERKRINVYGYIDFSGENVPPISSCLSCEAGYELYVGTPDLNKPGEPQDISFFQAVNKGFTALIVVSGAQGVMEGDYELSLELKPM